MVFKLNNSLLFTAKRVINLNSKRLSSDATTRPATIKRLRLSKTQIAFGLATSVGIIEYNTNDTFHAFVRHVGLTTKRSGIVAQATVRCFYDYRKTLNNKYETQEEYYNALDACHLRCALITLDALRQNGGIYIKLGQHISAMTYLLPPQWTDTMIPLQDHCPKSTIEEIDNMFKHDLKMGIDEIFSEFNPEPIGVASLAQVHTATLNDTNDRVAVKCQHPSLKEFIPLDIMLTQLVFNLLDVFFPEYPLTWLGDELQTSIYVEINFEKEAKNAIDTQNYFAKYKKQTALRIPNVISAHKRILIMEYITGRRLDDLQYLDENNISRAEVSSCLSHIFNNMIFTPNVGIHCDPHGGNLAIRACKYGSSSNPHNFEIILYDHGLYRHPTTEMRRDYAKFWLALFDQDQDKMKFYAKRFAHINDKQFPLFAAAITGRSIDTALNYDISSSRSKNEIDVMSKGILKGNFLTNLMSILATIPRIVLLILKTNDLTRHLDECLQNPLGPERTFLIMTQYCSKTVYDEDCEEINKLNIRWSWSWTLSHILAWLNYEKRVKKLVLYDIALWWKQNIMTML
ncbi:hypothetical protein TPHA_0B03600 [Tetrapisispora phaffii CBS 4417]|uniref:ABC1 atypical kinase-like domain-containing protein n=1 Tax=Tetrapisispora phaffii (strain ATCC 24235 / CBS 4417 / NBRC 1672 / NRRL Y-8282 / UCD 70-5) TaxID=1071381 RepID=G8BPU9_TETPH|nr:hypothetical protein TPHA_0B03600 [Tetrapisispora phaffii CBS 4417]CCE62030.1 hypothetical protein TPHA_0B03600 [Tetrapisispora phaffii CBS 4417]